MVPTNTLAGRVANTICPATQVLPTLDFSSLDSKLSYSYDSDINNAGVVYNVQDSAGPGVMFITSYPFTLPRDENPGTQYTVEVVLGTHFLTGGSLGIVLTSASYTPTADLTQCIKVIYFIHFHQLMI